MRPRFEYQYGNVLFLSRMHSTATGTGVPKNYPGDGASRSVLLSSWLEHSQTCGALGKATVCVTVVQRQWRPKKSDSLKWGYQQCLTSFLAHSKSSRDLVRLTPVQIRLCDKKTIIEPGAVKLVLWRHLMHLSFKHPVTSENQSHCTKLYNWMQEEQYFNHTDKEVFQFYSLEAALCDCTSPARKITTVVSITTYRIATWFAAPLAVIAAVPYVVTAGLKGTCNAQKKDLQTRSDSYALFMFVCLFVCLLFGKPQQLINRPYGLLTGYTRYFHNVQRNWGKERSGERRSSVLILVLFECLRRYCT